MEVDTYFNDSRVFACNLNAQKNAAFSVGWSAASFPLSWGRERNLETRLVCMYGLHCSWRRGFLIRGSWRCLIGSVRMTTNQRRRKDLWIVTSSLWRFSQTCLVPLQCLEQNSDRNEMPWLTDVFCVLLTCVTQDKPRINITRHTASTTTSLYLCRCTGYRSIIAAATTSTCPNYSK